MYKFKNYSLKNKIIFWVLIALTLAGKEQISLYIFLYGIFVFFLRKDKKMGISLSVVGIVWFLMCFFAIIPYFAHYRVEGFKKFETSMGIDTVQVRDVENSNYFLSRYQAFGNSYFEILFNMITHPKMTLGVFFGGDQLNK